MTAGGAAAYHPRGMKILALDTAMAACSVAVLDTGHPVPLATAFVAMERGHAEALAPMVRQAMQESGIGFAEIDRIAVTAGPGTFTGVRIGLAMARGLGLARGIPVIGIDTLSAIAANEPLSGTPLLVTADARNGEVYGAAFDGTRQVLRPPMVLSPAAAADDMPPATIVLGTGAKAVIAASGRSDLVLSRSGDLPVAARFGAMAATISYFGVMPAPLYLRAPDAKPQSAPLRKAVALEFRNAGPEAVSLLASIHGEAFETAWTPDSFTQLLAMPGAHATFAMEHGEPQGFVLTRVAADEAEIITIATRPHAQRRGIARNLLLHRFTELLGHHARHVFIEVAVSNAAARHLYSSLGFAEAGRRKNYYQKADGSSEDALVMRRELGA